MQNTVMDTTESIKQSPCSHRTLMGELTKKKSTAAAAAKSLQSCPTLCDPIDGSPPGSPIPGILQARILSPMHESEK